MFSSPVGVPVIVPPVLWLSEFMSISVVILNFFNSFVISIVCLCGISAAVTTFPKPTIKASVAP